MDLSFPPHASVNIGIPDSSYLNEPYKLRLPGIDRLCEFILQLGQGCLLYKLDLQRAYRQIPIDPKDYHMLGFRFNNLLYFDTRCPFGLKTSAMICQRTTKAVVHCFTQLGFLADVYLDDFYGADLPARASTAFTSLKQLLQELEFKLHPIRILRHPLNWFVSVLTSILRRCLTLFLPFACGNSCRNCLSGPSVRITQRSSCCHYWENFHSSLLASNRGEFSWHVY